MDNIDKLEELKNIMHYQTNLLYELNNNIKKLIPQQLKYISLSALSNEIGKSNQTIKYHLINNYEPDKDFKKTNGKIYIDIRIIPLIKEYYARKK